MDKSKNYYEILGVPRNATLTAIKRAYRQLARKRHPTADAGSPAEEFGVLKRAYETLANADSRQRYDQTLRNLAPARHPARLGSYLRPPPIGGLRRPIEPVTVSSTVFLSTGEAASGGVLPLDVPVAASCPLCGGTGGAYYDCPRCCGRGSIDRRLPVPLRIPPGVRDGALFQVSVDDPSILAVLVTVHVGRY